MIAGMECIGHPPFRLDGFIDVNGSMSMVEHGHTKFVRNGMITMDEGKTLSWNWNLKVSFVVRLSKF